MRVTGYISVQKLESQRSKSFPVCISLQTKAIKVSLGSPGLENIPHVPANRAEVAQNHDARNRLARSVILTNFGLRCQNLEDIFQSRGP